MAAGGHTSHEGRYVQDPGMMRNGPFPAPAGPCCPLDPLPPPELLENKIVSQAVEIDRLLMENRRLAAVNVEMRQELGAIEQATQTIQSHIRSIQTESNIQIRELVEKIRKTQDFMQAGETVQKELQQAHVEVQNLSAKRDELTRDIQLITEEIQKATADGKRLPELVAELDGLRQENQKLRQNAAFEYEKVSNMEQAELMRGMEMNLILLAREVEKLRADIMNAEKGELTKKPYETYWSPDPLLPSEGHVGGYSSVGLGHKSPTAYSQAYRRSHSQMTDGAPHPGRTGFPDNYPRYSPLASSGPPAVSRAGYYDVRARPQIPVAGTGEGMNLHSIAGRCSLYDAAK